MWEELINYSYIKSGIFQTATGVPALSPTKPKAIDDAIELFELQIPPYTKSLDQIKS